MRSQRQAEPPASHSRHGRDAQSCAAALNGPGASPYLWSPANPLAGGHYVRETTIGKSPSSRLWSVRYQKTIRTGKGERNRVRLGLRGKLGVAVSIYLGLLALVGLTGLYAAQVSLSGMHVAHEHHVKEISLLANLSSAVERVQSTVLLHVLTQSPAEQAAYEAQIGDLEREIDLLFDQEVDLQRMFGDEADVDLFEGLRGAWHEYLRALDEQFLPLSREERDVEALAIVREDGPVDLAYEQAVAQLTVVQATVESESRERLDLAEQEFAANRDRVLLALVLAGAFGLVFGLWHSSRLAIAIRALSTAARRVAAGDFGQTLRMQTGDEIESLADSFNVMTNNLQRMHDEQLAVERMKDEFVSMVSHELRTPLNGVIGMTDLLLQSDLGPQARTYAQGVQRSGEVLLAVIDDILDLSKIEAGKLDLESVALDVREVIAEVAQLFAERAQLKGVPLSCEVDAAVPDGLEGDPIRLRQVLLNLVGNALKFTQEGRVRLGVSLVEEAKEVVRLRFAVADTGIGVESRDHERLFQPFAQADSSTTRKYGGTGLGLSICQRLVHLMQGEIGVESQPGVGSTFWFTVPLRRAAASAGGPVRAAIDAPQPRGLPGRSTQRLLLVEDSWMNQQVALGMLEELGYEADLATDGREALEAIERSAYAAVLLDCQMPEMDGFQMTAELRRREATSGRSPVPVIAMTASAMPADRERCLASGMNDHLAKPVRIVELSAKLSRWVARTGDTPAAPEDVFDRSALSEVARLQRPGRPNLVAAIVERFRAEAPSRVQALRDALARGDAAAVSDVAHALKGDSRRIGGTEVGQLSAQIEALGRSGELADAAELVAALAAAMERLCAALDSLGEETSLCAS
jgi:signal transduction histidine kinase/DNA-binding response OmpR family regulator